MKKTILLFCCIITLAAFLRLYRLDSVPPGVNRDEASIGYTAYSLIKTGKDEYGRSFPLSFESFGDWKLPTYIYLTVPFVKILGPTELAIRLPSALIGIGTVAILYPLTYVLLSSIPLSLLSMVFLAISPWHIHLSRVESESNLAVFFTTLGLYYFFKAIHGSPRHMLLSGIFLSLPYYIYHGNHISSSLLVLGLVIIFWRDIPKTRSTFLGLGIFVVLVGIILSQTLLGADKTKISGTSIFGNPAIIHERIENPRNEHLHPQSLWTRFIHNRLLFAGETIMQNYLRSFSPEFLFISGGTNHAHNIEHMGNMYLVEAPILFLSIVLLVTQRKKSVMKFLLWWLIISPVAASITKDAPHTNRMFELYPLPAILSAITIGAVNHELRRKSITRLLSFCIIITLFILNISVYLDRYYVHFPRDESQYWGNPYKQLLKELNRPEYRGKQIIMSHPEYSHYIFFLLYSRFDPTVYQRTAVRYPPTDDAFVHVKQYDRFTFRDIHWEEDIKERDRILIDFTREVPSSLRLSYAKTEIFLPDGASLFTIIVR